MQLGTCKQVIEEKGELYTGSWEWHKKGGTNFLWCAKGAEKDKGSVH